MWKICEFAFLNKYSNYSVYILYVRFIFYMFDLCHYQTYSLSLKYWGQHEILPFNKRINVVGPVMAPIIAFTLMPVNVSP